MGIIHDVLIYIGTGAGYDSKPQYKGTIILEDDGWFEGFVCSKEETLTGRDFFIYGVYLDGKIINLSMECFGLDGLKASAYTGFYSPSKDGYEGNTNCVDSACLNPPFYNVILAQRSAGFSSKIEVQPVEDKTSEMLSDIESKKRELKAKAYPNCFYYHQLAKRGELIKECQCSGFHRGLK